MSHGGHEMDHSGHDMSGIGHQIEHEAHGKDHSEHSMPQGMDPLGGKRLVVSIPIIRLRQAPFRKSIPRISIGIRMNEHRSRNKVKKKASTVDGAASGH